ncbi:hypothetical protein F4678DRAFT_417805 [Xylaria arbuscula]|nr:hypothetical protein F4678DRAFT_417805 [Xylaria arbuscula]
MERSNKLAELEAQLRDAENRAREERQRAEREQQRADKEQQRADREQQRAEDAETGRLEEKQRADESEENDRLTSLDEYIATCHELVFSKLKVKTDKALTSQGLITNPRNKYCLTNLKLWADFLQKQSATFGELYATCFFKRRAFKN